MLASKFLQLDEHCPFLARKPFLSSLTWIMRTANNTLQTSLANLPMAAYPTLFCSLAVAAVGACCVAFRINRPRPRTFADQGCQTTSPMSVVWRIPELVGTIAAQLSLADQARMVVVSRALWATVTPLLWETLPEDARNRHIRHLLPAPTKDWLATGNSEMWLHVSSSLVRDPGLMGNELFQDETLDIRSAHWDRFFYHTKLVKTLVIMLGDPNGHSSIALLKGLDSLGVCRPFPRLESLHVRIWKLPADADVVRSLLSPSVKHLTLEFVGGVDDEIDDKLPVRETAYSPN